MSGQLYLWTIQTLKYNEQPQSDSFVKNLDNPTY